MALGAASRIYAWPCLLQFICEQARGRLPKACLVLVLLLEFLSGSVQDIARVFLFVLVARRLDESLYFSTAASRISSS